MIDLAVIEDDNLNTGMQLLKKAMLAKGWSIKVPYVGSVHCYIDRGDGNILHIYSTSPPTTSLANGLMANDKFATYMLLNSNNIKQPETVFVSSKFAQQELEQSLGLIKKHERVVVKPIDGGHGKGITTNINSKDKLLSAIEYARKFSKNSSAVIVQQMLQGELHDLRLAVVGGKFVAAINRLPAAVTGDGLHCVRELIEIENSTFRGEPYRAKLAVIDPIVAEEFLGEKAKYVPKKQEKVQVVGVANYGQGGELIDVTDDIPIWMIDEAEQIAGVSGLPVCGVDYLSAKLPNTESSQDELCAYFIEINKCPSLAIHDRPTVGKNRHIVEMYVDYLETL